MELQFKELEPTEVFTYFKEINQIPRCSGNEQAISNHLMAFAKKLNLEAIQDKWMNVIIKKKGSINYEQAPVTIIQGHLDMVCEKNSDTQHDFTKDPIKMLIEGDWLTADGTTLGADNGIAVAYIMAILASKDMPHPPLEAIFTVDEEVGLTGAFMMDKQHLKAKYFINLDSEEEGEITVGCAGGLKVRITLPVKYSQTSRDNLVYYKLEIKNLLGGHSGMEIDKNRLNADILLGRVLNAIHIECPLNLVDISGGTRDNVIPRESYATLAFDQKYLTSFKTALEMVTAKIKDESIISDPGVTIYANPATNTTDLQVISTETTEKLLFFLLTVPNGIQTMSASLEGMVESSLNIGKCAKEADEIVMLFSVRSNIRSLKYYITSQLKAFAKQISGTYSETADYTEWHFNPESKVLELAKKVYKETTGKMPIVKSIHAGLECGVFLEGLPDTEALSIGPDMEEVHSPNERLNISSTQRTWTYLLALLAAIQ